MVLRNFGFNSFFPNISSVLIYVISSITTLLSAVFFGPSAWGEMALFFQIISFVVAIGSFGIPIFISTNSSELSPELRTILLQVCLLSTGISGVLLSSLFFIALRLTIIQSDFPIYCIVLLFMAICISLYEFLLGFFAANLQFNFISVIRILNVSIPGLITVSFGYYGIGLNWVLIVLLFSYVLINSCLLFSRKPPSFSTLLSYKVLRVNPITHLRTREVKNALLGSWKYQKSLILSLFAFKCDLLLVALKSGTTDLASYSVAILCSEVSILFASGYFLKNLISEPSPFNVPVKKVFLDPEIRISLAVGILLTGMMFFLLSFVQGYTFFDDYNLVLNIFLMLSMGSPFLVMLKMRVPVLLRRRDSVTITKLFLIIILGKGLILICPLGLYSTMVAGLITSGSYLLGFLYMLFGSRKGATKNDSEIR
jgi:O-antigen/teichoic acid export membrane protein